MFIFEFSVWFVLKTNTKWKAYKKKKSSMDINKYELWLFYLIDGAIKFS